MSELYTIEAYAHALEAKIAAWFKKYFGALEVGSDAHKAAVAAHEELKTVVGITPEAPAAVTPAQDTSSAS